MRFLPALAALIASSQAVEAECLDAGDLGRGVVVTFDNGDETTMRRLADGSIQFDETYADGTPTLRLRSAHGVYFFEEYSIDGAGQPDPASRILVEFPQDPLTLPRPADGVTWSGDTVNLFGDGTQRRETTSATFVAGAPLVLGDCTYDTLNATLRYDWGKEGALTLGYRYLPALGAAIIETRQFDGEAGTRVVPVALDLAAK